MKKFIIPLFFTLSCVYNFAQNYQAFNSGRKSYFLDDMSYVEVSRIDSVNFEVDSILIFMSNVQSVDDYCFTKNGDSWLGEKLIIKENGDNIFLNLEKDSILIKTSAHIGEDWLVYSNQTDLNIFGTVIDQDTMTFLGINDSIKKISFQAYNLSMDSVEHDVNEFELILSKNYGMIKILNMLYFPDFIDEFFEYAYLRELNLIGLSEPDLGVKNITSFDIYDFQSGDELHVESSYTSYTSYYGNCRKRIFRYLDRVENLDSIIYTVEQTTAYWQYYELETTYDFTIDTIEQKYYADAFISNEPGEPYVEFEYDMHIPYLYKDTILKKVDKTWQAYYLSEGDCWGQLMIDGFCPGMYYFNGLGGPYYPTTWGWGDTQYRELVYYNVGGETQGIPFVLSGLETESIIPIIGVYPNPSDGLFTLEIINYTHEIPASLVDCSGRTLKSITLNDKNKKLDLSSYEPGVYYVISLDSETPVKLKLVKL